MTTRMLCLWFPNWAVQRQWRPAHHSRAVVLFAEGPRGRRVTACCGAAAGQGVRIGMPLAEAEALWSRPARGAAAPCFLPSDPPADREVLRELAWECEAFSPLVGLEEADAPECLLLDITGCTPLFESEHALGQELMASMAGRGWQCRAAVADTVGAAWALARYGTRGTLPPLPRERSAHAQTSCCGGEGRGEGELQKPSYGPLTPDPSPPNHVVTHGPPNRGRGEIGAGHQHFIRTPGRELLVTPRGEQASALTPLPAASLRLPADVLTRLRRLDIRTVGEVLSLPRASLPSRFGPELLLRLDQALGAREELISPERRPSLVEAAWAEETPVGDALALEAVLQRLVTEILDELQQRGEGVERLACLLSGPGGETARLSVELLRPTLDARHVMELVRLQLERVLLNKGVSRITLQAGKADRLSIRESSLWEHEDRSEQTRAFDKLIEQLHSHFGTAAVLQPQEAEEELPELASGDVPYVSATRREKGRSEKGSDPLLFDVPTTKGCRTGSDPFSEPETDTMSCLTRPLWLKRSPEPVRVESVTPEGPPERFHWREREHAVVHRWGPERITTGWWRGSHVRRDYYHVETTCGRRFWLFRELVSGEWFLHAAFD